MKIDLLEHFSDDAVRALAWSIGSRGLMSPTAVPWCMPQTYFEAALEEAWDWLLMLDREPEPLHAHLAAVSTWKVGLYFESLLTFWLMWNPRYSLLAQNLQVQGDGRTLGALDYLVRHRSGGVHHWEVAVKFYLQRQTGDAWSAWVGPNLRDRLDIKLSRMRDHQLPLSARPEATRALATVQVAQPPEQWAIVKGMFFQPWDGPACWPRGCATAVSTGQWVTASAFALFSEGLVDRRWCIREKPDWLSPARRMREQTFSRDSAIDRLRFEVLTRPQMWSCLGERADGVWFEDLRVVVVPDSWPLAGASANP